MTKAENPLTTMTSDEIAVKLAGIRANESALYLERRALEQEVERRQAEDFGEVFEKALLHDNFGLSVRGIVAITVRIPDSDWIEGNPDAQDLASEVGGVLHKQLSSTATIQGHKYRIKNGGDRFHISPDNARDIDAWNALLNLTAVRLRTAYDLDSLDIALPLVREALRPKT